MLRAQRLPALVVAASAVSLSLWGLGVGIPAASAAAGPNINPCGPLFTDPSGDAGGSDQMDIVSGNVTDSGGSLTTALTVKALSTTLVTGATADEYYMVFTGADGKSYYTNAEVSATGDITYSYGTDSGGFSGLGSATGTFDTAHNTVNVTVPLSVVGGGSAGAVLTSISGETDALEGAPSNPGVSGGLDKQVDAAGPQYDYQLGESCGGPGPTPSPSASPPGPPPPPQGPQRFDNFVSPQPNPEQNAQPPCCATLLTGEPSIGVDWVTNTTMYQGDLNTWQIAFRYTPGQAPTAQWLDRSHLSTSKATLDARLIVDHTGALRGSDDRTIVDQLAGVQSIQAYTDDDGGTAGPPTNTADWTPSNAGGIPVGPDHESLAAGPFATPLPVTANTSIYPHAVYYCGQAELLNSQPGPIAFCSRSDDGGLTWGPGNAVYQQSQCAGLHGKPRVGPDGTVYLPNKNCSAAGGANAAKGLLVSTDNGQTWTLHNIPGTSTDDNQPDPDVAVGGSDPTSPGTVYYAYRDGDHHAKVVVSTDRGKTWTAPFDLGAYYGIKNAQFPEVIAGDANRAAVSFIGTTTAGNDAPDNFNDPATGQAAVWHLYVAFTYDGGRTWQTVDATPNLPVQRGGVCMSGTGCTGSDRNMLDFNDMNIDRTGRVQVAYTDGCVSTCETNPTTTDGKFASEFSLVDQVCGIGLFGKADPGFSDDPSCGPTANLPEFPSEAAPVLLGAGLVGAFAVLRRRRRHAGSPVV